jgi:hypothetical protein
MGTDYCLRIFIFLFFIMFLVLFFEQYSITLRELGLAAIAGYSGEAGGSNLRPLW